MFRNANQPTLSEIEMQFPLQTPSRAAVFGTLLLLAPGILLLRHDAFAMHAAPELAVIDIPLAGSARLPDSEISAMAWYQDRLVLVPQYPERFADADHEGYAFAISKTQIARFVDGETNEPLTPQPIPIEGLGIRNKVEGYEGFEAIAFSGSQFFAAIETRHGRGAGGLLIRGKVDNALESIDLRAAATAKLRAQTSLGNMGYEGIMVKDDRVLAFYEVNGTLNPHPVARVFDTDLRPLGDIPMSHLEYRITDTTAPDSRGRFWVSNFFWPGATWRPASCPLSRRYGVGPLAHQAVHGRTTGRARIH